MKNKILLLIIYISFVNFSFSQPPATHLNFDGVNDAVSLNLLPFFHDTTANAFSVEVLVNPSVLNFSRIFFAQASSLNFFSISMSSGGNIYAYLNNSTSRATTAAISASTWTYITVTKEVTTNAILIYFNGVLQATTGGGTSSTGINGLLTLGSRTGGTQFFNGNIDEVRIWNRVLPVAEIVNNYNCELQNPLTQTGLVGYYKFNQGLDSSNNTAITTLNDSSSTINNGTLSGFTLTGATSNWKSGSQIVTGTNCSLLETKEFINSNNLIIYPNPSIGIFTISLQEDATITVNDILGKVIYANKVKAGNNTIDISNYQSGIYLLHVKNENGSVTKKIIKE